MKNPKLVFSALVAGMLAAASVNAQQYPGYTLVAPQNSTTVTLLDTASVVYHTWSGLTGQTAYSNYVMPGGTLVRTVKTTNSVFTGGGMAGRVQKVDYNGTLLWDYTYSTTTYCSHHDICPLPNGNVILIAYELKSSSQVTQAGCQSAITMWPDHIVEVQPTGASTGTIVWEWHLWDHLCQSYNSAKDNYVTNTADHPELYNINDNPQKEIWHMNGIDYNPILDQIVLSAHNTNEFYVIDHSTTTAEAASHAGGRGGRGGDFLYRWGSPSNYGQSGNTNFNVLHDAHWVPEGCPTAGNLVALNNKGISNTQSCVDQVTPPVSGYNYTYTANTAWLPATYTLRQNCNGGTSNMGNSQQLPNGNMLICLAISGTIYEINSAGTSLWTYTASGSVAQAFRYNSCHLNNAAPAIPTITANGNVLTSSAATTYQWYQDGVQIAGATGQSYSPSQSGTYLVRVTDANGCTYSYSAIFDFTLATGIENYISLNTLNVFPNPTNGVFQLTGELVNDGNFEAEIYDLAGSRVLAVKNEKQIDLSAYPAGIYMLIIRSENFGTASEKIVLVK